MGWGGGGGALVAAFLSQKTRRVYETSEIRDGGDRLGERGGDRDIQGMNKDTENGTLRAKNPLQTDTNSW